MSEKVASNLSAALVSSFSTPSRFLRRALTADAALTAVTGLALAFGANLLSPVLGLPVGLLRLSGAILIPVAVLIGRLATRDRVYRPYVIAVIACNVLWAIDSIALLFTGWVEPTLLGEIFTVGQALIVAVLADLEFMGLRRSTVVDTYTRR